MTWGGEGLFEEIDRHLAAQGLRLREGPIADASITEAPSSTKKRAGARDPETHQAKQGKTWHFGMKVQSIPPGTVHIRRSGRMRQAQKKRSP